ncbi:5-deoxy-glucuronate isomerase [Deinococcus cellulosilyticus]|uniref:5-deoxy-glucuronate isomerase n=1 Tax=Deinococcus cellulosilyticus (strain DSM 18568 / NBRC 106333 / KACC 11606 / 5516J-15) TaxID=1223518 RepID=A0A511N095_DEIC1|nr:5-deoxy-glucuronate isomerase [Deinococcus cellulosilyticus]GEM46264.1 5-deoxy-glucuronate isomerase [Deinococcus cellulosilyticus NBRC 106333 = KACC 11606]
MKLHLPSSTEGTHVTPQSAGWKYLEFHTVKLQPEENWTCDTGGQELALVPLSGALQVNCTLGEFTLKRASVFAEVPHVLYLPPAQHLEVQALETAEFAIGLAPAEGHHPARLIQPEEIRVEIRGGANATRKIAHILGEDLPAERLVLFEVYTPSGNWSSWPPHRHDHALDSPYLEEVYYYRIEPQDGYAIQRVYTDDGSLDEVMLVRHDDTVLVPRGYHPVVAPPGNWAYYLNYLAGESRASSQAVDDPTLKWMRQDWEGESTQPDIFRDMP